MKQFPLLFLTLLIFLVLTGCTRNINQAPVASNGELDLQSWNFKEDGVVTLDGQWTLYRQKLLTPEELSAPNPPKPDGTITVPGYWPAKHTMGYVTCRLRIRVNPGQSGIVIRMGDISFAYRLWINGTMSVEVGRVGMLQQEEVPDNAISVASVPETENIIDLVLHISNFHNFNGGISESIRLGREVDIRAHDRETFGYALIVCGCLLVMGIYHLLLFLIRPSERAPLYFGLFCLQLGIWYLAANTSGRFLLEVLPFLSIQSLYRIDLLSFYFSCPMLLMFVHSNFPEEALPLIVPLYWVPTVICCLVVLTTPSYIFSYTLTPYALLILLALVYLCFVTVRSIYHKREGSVLFSLGFTFFVITAINDILYLNQLLNTAYIMPLGILTLTLSNSIIMALRFFKAFSTVESLSRELEDKNIVLSRMDQIKDEFLANTSHELRTPLNGIIGISESLIAGAAGRLPEKAMANLSMIFSSSKRLAGLVNDILDFSKLKNSDIKLEKKELDIKTLINGVLSISRNIVGRKALTLVETIPENIPYVLADENRLQQILYNLIGNAVKFTDQGEIRIGAAQKGSMVEIWVSDTGSGIPEDQFNKIFQAFEQVDSAPSRQFEGTGLGLSITRHLVELHGGITRVESTVGEGSTFFFTIPVGNGDLDTSKGPEISGLFNAVSENNTVPERYLSPVTLNLQTTHTPSQVLVADDDLVNLQVVANHLSLENISFTTASDGIEVLKQIESGEVPQILLLDIMMPKMTGYEVCRILRETYSSSELPIIMLTAKNHVADLVEGYKAGANDYLSKPFSKDELISRVMCHLDLKEAFETLKENQRLEREVELEKQQKEMAKLREEKTMLEMLRYQLNPHFLFNSLTSIRGAVSADRDAACQMITHLAEFSRLALFCGNMEILTVAREIEIIHHYLSMEQMRFGDYLTVSIKIDPAAKNLQVPSFIIQPLVENAIKYGSRTSQDALEISIVVETQEPENLSLKISNTGAWVIPGTTDKKESTGTGIAHVRQRLERYYSDKYTFEEHIQDDCVIFEINIPWLIPDEHHYKN